MYNSRNMVCRVQHRRRHALGSIQWKLSGSNVFRYLIKPERHRNFVLFLVLRAQVLSLHGCRRANATSCIFSIVGELPIMTIGPSKEFRHGGTFQLLAGCGASRYSEARGVTTKMPTHTEILDTPLPLASNCFVRDCSKLRFMGYYVCAEYFVFYASARYTESLVIKVEPIGFWCVYPEANCSLSLA
jgi:hypothetical protein